MNIAIETYSAAVLREHLVSCTDPGIFIRGVPGQSDKKSSDDVFFFFFLVLSLFYRSQMVNFKEIYHFSRFQRGSNIFQGGGSNFLSPDPKRIGGYSDQPGVRPSVRLSVRLSVRRQKLVRSITFIPFEIF